MANRCCLISFFSFFKKPQLKPETKIEFNTSSSSSYSSSSSSSLSFSHFFVFLTTILLVTVDYFNTFLFFFVLKTSNVIFNFQFVFGSWIVYSCTCFICLCFLCCNDFIMISLNCFAISSH